MLLHRRDVGLGSVGLTLLTPHKPHRTVKGPTGQLVLRSVNKVSSNCIIYFVA
jgi:hypothetical protein